MIPAPSKGIVYQGEYNPKKEYTVGDIAMIDGDPCVYLDDCKWETLTTATIHDDYNIPVKCDCCGAPLIRYDGHVKCEYCGTMYK